MSGRFTDVAKFPIDSGADPDAQDDGRHAAIARARASDHGEIMELLKSHE